MGLALEFEGRPILVEEVPAMVVEADLVMFVASNRMAAGCMDSSQESTMTSKCPPPPEAHGRSYATTHRPLWKS